MSTMEKPDITYESNREIVREIILEKIVSVQKEIDETFAMLRDALENPSEWLELLPENEMKQVIEDMKETIAQLQKRMEALRGKLPLLRKNSGPESAAEDQEMPLVN